MTLLRPLNSAATSLALLGILTAAACQSPRSAGRTRRTASEDGLVASDAQPAPNPYRDPVARASLRERALALLASSATNGLPEERANAMEALTTTPGRLYPQVQRGVGDEVVGVRSVAAMSVGKAKLQAAADLVRPLVRDSAAEVRLAAMFALHQIGESVDISPMATHLTSGPMKIRALAAYLLGEMGDSSALGLLREAGRQGVGKSAPADVRLFDLQVAEARIKLGDDNGLQDVRASLFPARPEDLEATALACQIVGQVKDQVSVNRLIVLTAAQDDSKQFMPAEIRLAAAAALARLGQRQGSFIAEQYRTNSKDALRSQAAFVLGETLHTENLPILEGMMSDRVGRVRVSAAAAIVKITEADGTLQGIGGTPESAGTPTEVLP